MADRAETIERMKAALSKRLEGRCNGAIILRMQGQLDKVTELGWSMESTLIGIRTALRLFVDEQVADELHQQLVALAGPDPDV